MICTLPRDWHTVPAPLPFHYAPPAAPATGVAATATKAPAAASSGVTRLNLIRIVALPNLQFLTSILIPALPSHRTMSPGQPEKGSTRQHVMRAVLRHSRKWYTTPPPSAGQATNTAVGINEIGRLTTSFATNGATSSPPKVATRMWYPSRAPAQWWKSSQGWSPKGCN